MTTAADTLNPSTGRTGKFSFGPWSCCARAPGEITHPDQLDAFDLDGFPALVPGTVAASLQAAGKWDLTQTLDADAKDWWYRSTFNGTSTDHNRPCFLCFDGLATLAEVWLNGQLLLKTDNMFRAYQVDIAPHLRDENELVLGFRSLTTDLQQKRPRPRWKTNLVNHQQMRWRRTTLLGRIPGWTPPVQPVGPWRAIRFEHGPLSASDVQLTATLEGQTGVVTIHARIPHASPLERATLRVGDARFTVPGRVDGEACRLDAEARIANPSLWWPHTHGEQVLHPCLLEFEYEGTRHEIDLGRIGFRQVQVSQENGFAISVNGIPIYCRGACWTVSDIVTVDGSVDALKRDLCKARDAGANMLRVGGTMAYESDTFYRLCDELGILVWQDFMFANMDYPVDDFDFAHNIQAEAIYQLTRLARHPSVAVYCGNSEVEQQAAMLGIPPELWRNQWFADRLPALCGTHHPGTAYVPSTPSGGVMPFHVKTGVTHYYGVGAYLRPPSDVRRADVKFTPECLGFANLPEASTVSFVGGGNAPALHDPRWKQRVPRDIGAGWDFEDVRDHYLRHHFGVDPVQLRCFDMPRYLQLSRVVTGEMMTQAFAEWRSSSSTNRGALVWFFKDLWPGAGWGIVDSLGMPKAAFYSLRRAWQTRQITVTDEGLDGLHLHVTNETTDSIQGFVELLLLNDNHIVVARQEMPCMLTPRSMQLLTSDEILHGFYDVCYAYRFGPPKHDVVIATLLDQDHRVLSEAFHFLQARDPARLSAVKLDAQAEQVDAECCQVTLESDRFLQSVSFDVNGYLPDDNYFHLPPLRRKVIRFKACSGVVGKFKAHVEALNLQDPVKITMKTLLG